MTAIFLAPGSEQPVDGTWLLTTLLSAGSAYYDNVRPLAYPDSDAVLICFDISRPETLDSVLKKVSAHWVRAAGMEPRGFCLQGKKLPWLEFSCGCCPWAVVESEGFPPAGSPVSDAAHGSALVGSACVHT